MTRTGTSTRTTAIAVLLSLVAACGGTTYGGLGGDLDGATFDDSGAAGDQAIFPTDDAASAPDSDASFGDTAVDSGSDASVVDTAIDDGAVADSALDDTGATDDTGIADTAIDDTATADSGIVDTGVVDSGADDTGVVDTGDVDTGVVDTGVVDTGVVDTGVVDTGPPPILSSNPGQVYCDVGGTANVLCAVGQNCCGKQDTLLSSFSWSCTSGSCDKPTWGSSRTYPCNEKADCGGFLCCVNRSFTGTMLGTKCHTDTSPCGDETACMTNADCPGGQTCQAATIQDGDFTIGMCK